MKKLLFLIFLLSFTLSGCKDYVEVEDLTIVTAVAIDLADEAQDGYKISIEVAKFTSDTTNVSIIEAQGATFAEAINNAVKITGNELYLSHAQAVIISEQVAQQSIYPFIDYAYRNTDFRLNTVFLIAKDATAAEILSANSLIDDIAGIQIKDIADSNNLISTVPSIPIYEFIDDLSSIGVCGILPVITLTTDTNDNQIRVISGLAVFDQAYIYGYLDENQTKTLSILQNETSSGIIFDESDQNSPSYNIISSKTEISPNYENGQLSFDFNISMKIEIAEQSSDIDTKNPENEQILQENIENSVQNNIIQLINKQKSESGADFLALGNMTYRKYPDLWNEISYDFENVLKNLNYTLKVDCEIVSTGLISAPIEIMK